MYDVPFVETVQKFKYDINSDIQSNICIENTRTNITFA